MKRWLLLVILVLLTLSPLVVSGHRLIIDYGVESIYVEAYYGGGTPVRDGDVKIYYPDGKLYLEGKTDEEGKFSFDPGFRKEWLVVVESSGHREEETINMTEAAGGSTKESEMPLYLRVFAGFGYLLGILGISLWYKGFKKERE
ncbi:MAG: hypothetical protein SYNGOMJ08_00863 [Candidatus Syntrophoarchaeum sp. GoM_oil]|nr:MAG: hypothetical protein SYNGOMJ08_00863 [Candidatus Syntrophoarchaeum sp. GoM_oil]